MVIRKHVSWWVRKLKVVYGNDVYTAMYSIQQLWHMVSAAYHQFHVIHEDYKQTMPRLPLCPHQPLFKCGFVMYVAINIPYILIDAHWWFSFSSCNWVDHKNLCKIFVDLSDTSVTFYVDKRQEPWRICWVWICFCSSLILATQCSPFLNSSLPSPTVSLVFFVICYFLRSCFVCLQRSEDGEYIVRRKEEEDQVNWWVTSRCGRAPTEFPKLIQQHRVTWSGRCSLWNINAHQWRNCACFARLMTTARTWHLAPDAQLSPCVWRLLRATAGLICVC